MFVSLFLLIMGKNHALICRLFFKKYLLDVRFLKNYPKNRGETIKNNFMRQGCSEDKLIEK